MIFIFDKTLLRKNNYEFRKFRNLKIKIYLLYTSHNIAKNLSIYPNLTYYLFLFILILNLFYFILIIIKMLFYFFKYIETNIICVIFIIFALKKYFVYFKYLCQNRYKNCSSLLKAKESSKH